MVDYNKQVRETIKLIDKFAIKGKFTVDDIAFHIIRETGFGDKFTKKYLESAIEKGFFVINKDGIVSEKGDE